jgi:hypothetical protein
MSIAKEAIMPSRMINGDAIWTSMKLLSVPEELRVEYAWVLPSADANGCCEYNPALIFRNCYAMLRDGWTPAKVAALFDALEAAKMVYRFEHGGKQYAFFLGMEREGRLPKPSERSRYKNSGSIVPVDGLAAFLGTDVETISRQYRDVVARESPLGIGNGIGLGNGLGIGTGTGHNALQAKPESREVISSINSLNGHNGKDKNIGRPEAAVETETEYNPAAVGKASVALFAPPASGDPAEWLADVFRILVDANRYADATRIPKDWKTVWAGDFRKMLDIEDDIEAILEYICYSQTASQQKYFRRPAMLVDKHTTLLFSGVQKLKKAKAWEPIWQRFLAQLQLTVPPEEEIEFLDESKMSPTAFNIEDEDNDLV